MQTNERSLSINLKRLGLYSLLALATLNVAALLIYLRLFPSEQPDFVRRLDVWAVVHSDLIMASFLIAVAVIFSVQAHNAHQETLRKIVILQEQLERAIDDLRSLRDDIHRL
jgi:hypothetical protein